MYWHADLTMRLDKKVGHDRWLRTREYICRGHATDPDFFEKQIPFDAIVTVTIDPDQQSAYAHGAKTEPDQRLAVRSWRDLGRFLRDRLGVIEIDASRGEQSRQTTYDTTRL